MTRSFTHLLCLLGTFGAATAYGEGTKQLQPTASDTTILVVDSDNYGNFGAESGPAASRLQFRIGDPANEQVFFGFSAGFQSNYRLDVAGTAVTYSFRVLAPDGTVVRDWQAVTEATANLNTFAQVTEGPSTLAATGGYDVAGYTLANPLTEGDYFVEFRRDDVAGAGFNLPRFDVTVATRGANPTALPGRVFSLNWAIGAPQTKDLVAPYGFYDREFKGAFYVYSPEGLVSKVDFANAGFRPYLFNISFNATGPVGFLEPLENLRSVEGQARTNPEYPIFLSEPPAAYYPSGTYGTTLDDADYPRLYGCTGGDEYYVEVAVTKPGQIEVLIDEDGGDNVFTYGTADRMLSYDVKPRAGERAPYVRQILWDGKDGFGNPVADGLNLDLRVTFSQTPYHLPIYDAEFMVNGFAVEMVRPAPPADYTFTYQWDDSDITTASTGTKVQLEGTPTNTHTWTTQAYGDLNTVNTYWFARREAVAKPFNRADPACGCSTIGTLTVGGSVFADADGSRTRGNTESGYAGVAVRLYDDLDEDGVLGTTDTLITTETTDAVGGFGFAINTAGTAATLADTTRAGTDDGVQIVNTFYSQFHGLGSYRQNDANGNPRNYTMTTSLRFGGQGLPRLAEITNAYVELTASGASVGLTQGGATSVVFYGSADVDPVDGATKVPLAHDRTLADVTWSIVAEAAPGATYTVGGLRGVIQELVNRPGYRTGHAIHLIGRGSGSYAGFEGHEAADAAVRPRLIVEYTDYGLPKTLILEVDQAGVTDGNVLVSNATTAVGLYEPAAYNCFNAFAFAADRDGDGVTDASDLDNDNDGIADAQEDGGTGFSPTGDEDGDGVLNFEDDADPALVDANGSPLVDADGDGVLDRYDADGDGVPDVYDLDSDNDGVTDLVEAGGTDADGDGRVDADADIDNDGVADVFADLDGDGLADAYDNNGTDGPLGTKFDATTPSTSVLTDRDGDGVTDGADADGDGLPNYVDLDSDNDGMTDIAESGQADADGDGRVDAATDADADGLADTVDPRHDGPAATPSNAPANAGSPIALADADGDGIPAPYDLDSDNDGIADVVEAGATDTDGDGRVDAPADADGDGVADAYDVDHAGPLATPGNAPAAGVDLGRGPDTDRDGVADFLDLDADGDGIADVIEAGGADADGDGRVDLAADADADGLADIYDPLHDGPDAAIATAPAAGTALVATAADSGDGTPAGPPPANDLDGDGVADYLDLDTDNDGIPDLVEAMGADADGDGRVDDATDADGDGLADVVDGDDDATPAPGDGNGALVRTDAAGGVLDTRPAQGNDLDGDGFANWRDRDTDNDGIPDLTEAGISPAAADQDGDGRLDPAFSADADGDGWADVYDADANDGPTAPAGSTNPDGTPAVQTLADTDGDGAVTYGVPAEGFTAATDGADADGRPDYRDLDSDDDGITDNVEQNGGSVVNDRDAGTLDGMVPVGSGDYAVVNANVPLDSDGDGVPDYRDLDADNDGILDNYEAVCTGCPPAGVTAGADANFNGVIDDFEGLTAANASGGANVGATPNQRDGDTAPDYLDFDTDGDGAPDFAEGFDDDKDGYALDDLMARATAYETASANPVHYDNAADADADGIPDWLDGLATAGNDETVRPPFLDPASAFWLDADGNGVADLFDVALGGAASGMPDRDGVNDRDWRDGAVAAPVPVELIRFTAEASACDITAAWTVGTEQDVSHYVLEASADGTHFEAFAKTAAQRRDAYRATISAVAEVTYLRLRTVDADGGEAVSAVVTARTNCGAPRALEAYPNPVAAGAALRVGVSQPGTVELIDVTGRVVFSGTGASGATIDVPTDGLAAGLYVVRVADATLRVVVR